MEEASKAGAAEKDPWMQAEVRRRKVDGDAPGSYPCRQSAWNTWTSLLLF